MALTVKLVYGTRIRNDVMDEVELDNVMLRYIEKLPTITLIEKITDTKWISQEF